MVNILFTCVGRRTYLLKYFKEQWGNSGKIVAVDMQLTAPALTMADIKLQVPSVYADDYVDRMLDICTQNDIRAILCLSDLELPILADNREKFEAIGVIPIVSTKRIIDICLDKYRAAQYINSIGLDTPLTFVNTRDVGVAIKSGALKFPLVLKPRWGSGSMGIEFVNNYDELEEMYSILRRKVKRGLFATVSEGDECILIQQKIEGQEYGLDVMNDLKGNNRGVSVKKKLFMRAGETDKAQIVGDDDLIAIGRRLGSSLRHVGNLDVDVFEKDGKYYVLELNPRFGGGFPFSYEAGVNFPKAILEWLKGNDIDDSILIPKYGMTFAKCDYLVNIG